MSKIKRKLFAFDLDGTLLSDSKDGTIPQDVKNTINLLKKDGHIVCIFTGRPWRATKKIYAELDLDTIATNYNGAHIHNPTHYEFIPKVSRIAINNVMRIVESEELKKVAQNIVIEGPGFLHLQNKQKSHFTESFILKDENTLVISPINYVKMDSDPTGVLVEIKPEYAKSVHQIRNYFRAKFGDLAAFDYWDTGKDNNPILEFTNFKARKDIALIQIARYYKIDMSNTIAFGDGFNDVKMLKVAGIGVAMANASEGVKSYANVVSKHTNKNGGVAKFIKWYLQKGYKTIDQTIYEIGQKNPVNKQILSEV